MHLTSNELGAASSVVAALAIIGGYLGVRSANQNALKVAREERASKRAEELAALKRVTYVKCIAATHSLALRYIYLKELEWKRDHAASEEARREFKDKLGLANHEVAQAVVDAGNAEVELALVAPEPIHQALTGALVKMREAGAGDDADRIAADSLEALRVLMRDDLNSSLPEPSSGDRRPA